MQTDVAVAVAGEGVEFHDPISRETYWTMVEAGYDLVRQERFEVAGFISQAMSRLPSAETTEQRVTAFVEVSEVLGNALNAVELPNMVEDYVKLRGSLSSLTEQEKAFCRLCLKGAEPYAVKYYAESLDKGAREGQVAASTVTTSHLVTLLT